LFDKNGEKNQSAVAFTGQETENKPAQRFVGGFGHFRVCGSGTNDNNADFI
jgi:hypothetical protein